MSRRKRDATTEEADGSDKANGAKKSGKAAKARKRKRRRLTPRAMTRIRTMAYASPFISQAVMLAVMLISRQWLFVAILLPNLLATFASFLLFTTESAGVQDDDDQTTRSESNSTGDEEGRDDFEALPCVTFEALQMLKNSGQDEHPNDTETSSQSPDRGVSTASTPSPLSWRHIVRRWLGPPTLKSRIGVGKNGVFTIDLKRQGPHALVAGTTGSGKSVFLQSWCMAMALSNPPSRLNFVFMDFKGGSAFSRLEALPHTVGNVCDLNLKHAVRALLALEAELKRREQMVADASTADIAGLAEPPPLLVIVIDEFHALKDQLPDYMDRLMSIASLGRSLGMHLVACTQNPLGQVTDGMKANMSLDICLRVRDSMQSHELLGGPQASRISPKAPGCAYRNDGESVEPFRCAPIAGIDALVAQIRLASRFMEEPDAATLFTSPLPKLALGKSATSDSESPSGSNPNHHPDYDPNLDPDSIPFGLADDGFTLSTGFLPLNHGNIAVIGGPGNGKTTLLSLLAKRLCHVPGIMLRRTHKEATGFKTRTIHTHTRTRHGPGDRNLKENKPPLERAYRPRHKSSKPALPETSHTAPTRIRHAAPPRFPRLVWLVDDADALIDPLAMDAEAQAFREALSDANSVVVFAVETSRHVRVPEQCVTRLVFPTGERSADLMDGVPSALLSTLDHDDFSTPGRAVLIEGAKVRLVQCFQD
ncbi:FtsK/SpoIIIE domain-containing protein [Bifidobacterium sp. ESL0790]|uniref:FtsK/SpoIIIE domain-containing protein n=1 Tax=Bifidobacterium sp. ESL0790 TaxID=2983233 RepID=UPI0023F9FC4E|nr:FtsK/SpoIIIE domain-containing protein [Bifidobacterium sp. ESL0790]WEV73022.1 FtsK/SpoIIIE domain-containing protein [Bifidobacterium sp. ESL0790]